MILIMEYRWWHADRKTKAPAPLPTMIWAMSKTIKKECSSYNFSWFELRKLKANHGDETHSLSSKFTKGKSSKHARKIHQVYKIRIHFICAFRKYVFSRKEGLTVPRAASLAISPTYSGNNRLLQIIDLSQGLFIQCQFFLCNYQLLRLFSSMLISATVWAWENHTDNIHSGTVIGLSFTEDT